MPIGLLNVLTKDEILDLHAFVEAGGFQTARPLETSPLARGGRMSRRAVRATDWQVSEKCTPDLTDVAWVSPLRSNRLSMKGKNHSPAQIIIDSST